MYHQGIADLPYMPGPMRLAHDGDRVAVITQAHRLQDLGTGIAVDPVTRAQLADHQVARLLRRA